MKKIGTMILTSTLVLTMSVTTVFAAPKWDKGWAPPGLMKKGGFSPGIAKKIFNDLDDYPWAKKAVEKMKQKGLIQGYGNGIFAPQKAVTKLETIIMALRVMGWEDETKSITALPKKYKGKAISEWAKGYVTVAYEKGILDDVDMMYFSPEAPAQRHEVAKYVIRALGYEEEAQEHMNVSLPFVDAAAVPQGSVGYVYLVNEMALMRGDDAKRFNPMGTLTRAEMAVLFQRLDGKVDSEIDEGEFSGEVHRVYEETIVVQIDGQLKSFAVDQDDVVVYDNNHRIAYSDIEEGSIVLLEIEDNKVVYIEIREENDQEDKIISRYSGKVAEIKDSEDNITIQDQKMKITFEVIDDVKVYFRNKEGSFDEIKIGDSVIVIVDNKNRAREIYVDREKAEQTDEEIEGVITDIDLSGIYHITIDNQKYGLSKDAQVKIDGKTADLDELLVGMQIEAELEDDIIISIEAESVAFELEGTIKVIEDDKITIKKENDRIVTYKVAEDVKVIIDGESNKDIDDLLIGDVAEFELVNNLIVEIKAKSEFREIEGIVQEVQGDSIEIKIGREIREYTYADIFVVYINGRISRFNNLEKGMEATLRVKNNLVYNIDAEDNEFQVEGTIAAITQTSDGYKLTLSVDDEEFIYEVSEDVTIEIEDEDADLSDLEVDQEGIFEIVNNVIVEINISITNI